MASPDLAVRCKPDVNKWRGLVLRICIRPLHGAFVLLAIMDIRAHPITTSAPPNAPATTPAPNGTTRSEAAIANTPQSAQCALLHRELRIAPCGPTRSGDRA